VTELTCGGADDAGDAGDEGVGRLPLTPHQLHSTLQDHLTHTGGQTSMKYTP